MSLQSRACKKENIEIDYKGILFEKVDRIQVAPNWVQERRIGVWKMNLKIR